MEISKQIIEQEEKVRKLWAEGSYIKYRVESDKLLTLQNKEDLIIDFFICVVLTFVLIVGSLAFYLN